MALHYSCLEMSASGRVSRTRRLSTTVRNCTRDEGGPFEAGSQVQVSSHRKLLSSRAKVVSVAETSGPAGAASCPIRYGNNVTRRNDRAVQRSPCSAHARSPSAPVPATKPRGSARLNSPGRATEVGENSCVGRGPRKNHGAGSSQAMLAVDPMRLAEPQGMGRAFARHRSGCFRTHRGAGCW
jgi:hypothetical protein